MHSRSHGLFYQRLHLSQVRIELHHFACDALVYLFMPDHGHFVLGGKTENSDPLKVMYRFSQKTGYWFTNHSPHIRWQKDFYDHIVSRDEEVERHIRYILNNPVRAKLVMDWRDYPFKGSTVYNFEEW